MGLLLKEIKKLFFSKVFIVYSALVIIFGILNCQQVLNKNLHSNIYQPQNMTIYTNDSRTIMDNVTTQLEEEVKNNNFKTYQFGFLKEKRLSKEKVETVKHLLSKMKKTNDFQIFKTYSDKVAHEIGWGSYYSARDLHMLGEKSMSQSDFNKERAVIQSQDLYYGAYGRYLSDVMGIILGILPFFLSAYLSLIDHKTNTYRVIYSRNTSSFKLMSLRLLAIVLLSLLPAVIFSIYFNFIISMIHGFFMRGLLTFYKIFIMWLLPIVLVTSVLGMLITSLLNSYLGIIIQFILWFINLNIGATHIEGNYGYLLIPRHNSLFNASYFYDNLLNIYANRISYFVVGMVLLALTTLSFSLKRKGVISGVSLFKNRSKV